ncbi:surface-adhesin E family protein [Polynucleobacter sp. MWH-UH2A]|uniref:surface-adhesin E family protein n=1 Tax=Polynucleobacter sp. MWH-UH2A TaxID=1855617 RepID=UPI001BFE2FD5|nr:surface-adhesin E family protein [Polynucleobacter sp. MWH-UH2A]QWD64665.1 hypothetical protein IC571_03270 [Polynucleobacter sp. MWH-UH2A]
MRLKIPPFFKNLILVGLTAILLNPLSPSHAKWVFISNDNVGNAYYYEDSKTVSDPANEQVSTWQLISYAESLGAPNGEPTQSVIQDISYYCRVGYESYKQFYIGYYSGPEGSGVSVDQADTSNSNWERVIPDTMSYVLYKFFCRPPNIPS